jgi:hypothetical protein
MLRALIFAITLLLVALAAPAAAPAKPSHRIVLDSGIGGVRVGMRLGPIKHKKTVRSILGRADGVVTEQEVPRLYLATYEDEALGVYLRRRAGHHRGASDKVVGVVTFAKRYKGRLEVGKHFKAHDDKCAPADKRTAPGGGPRRVSACINDPSGDAPIEDINGVGVFDGGVGSALFSALVQGALDDLGCENRACD